MFQRMILAVQHGSSTLADKTSSVSVFASDTKNGFFTILHHAMMLLGLTSITLLTLMFVKPNLVEKFKELSPFNLSEIGRAHV